MLISLLCSLAAIIEMVLGALKFRFDAEFIFEETIEISLFAFKLILPLVVVSDEPAKLSLAKE